MSVGIVAGCSGGDTKSAGTEAQTAKGDASAPAASNNGKKLDISVSFFNIGSAFPDRNSDQFLKFIQDKFNVNIVDKVISYADYKEKYQLWAASGDLPDIFSDDVVNTEQYYSRIKQGIVRPLPSDLNKYPNVQKVLQQEDTKGLTVDGKYYMIPRLTYTKPDEWAIERAVVVRKDWMEKLGLKAPVTYDDYLGMFKAFALKDPDGDGKDDTVGLTFRTNTSFLLPVAGGTFPNVINSSWVKENGKYIPFYASDRMKDVAKQLRQLYTEKALDQDFAIMKPNDGFDKFGQGKVGALAVQATPNALNSMKNAWNKYNKDKKFEDAIQILPISWAAADGNRYRYTAVTFWSESYFSSKVDDEKMDRILQMYNWLLSDEFKTFKRYGFEGKDYKKEGDKYVILREQGADGRYKTLGSLYPSYGGLFGSLAAWWQQLELDDDPINKVNYGDQLWTISHDAYKSNVEKLKPVPTNFKVELLYTPAKSKLSAIDPVGDMTKVILGKDDPVAMWDSIVKGYDNKGLQQAIKEVNDEVQKQGLDK
jgi:putative aldouronate transport system substrate-binding protein